MNTIPTLEDRIEAALQPDAAVTRADIAALIEEVEAIIAKAEKDLTMDQTRSSDPRAVRQATIDAILAANRLRPLLLKLQTLHNQKQTAAWLATVPAYGQRCTAEWWKDNERRAVAQQAEGHRHANFLARMTKEQEERENREAEERFAESQRKRWGE